jgi:hypothetical protein
MALHITRRPRSAAWGFAALALVTTAASAQTLTVVPNANEALSGGFGSPAPLRFNSFNSITGSRNQQLYDASQFSNFNPAGNTISQLRYRPIDPAGVGGDRVTASNVVITMSTTARSQSGPNRMSETFSDNIGADSLVVYSGPLTLITERLAGPNGTFAFDYVITFQQPFNYTPANGNLLMDVIVPVGATVTGNGFFGSFPRFDATSPASPNGIASLTANADATAASGFFSLGGTVTQFVSTPVPTPGSAALLAIAALTTTRRRRA